MPNVESFWLFCVVLSYELNIAYGLECYVGVQAQVGFLLMKIHC